jgi:hypothetical protein
MVQIGFVWIWFGINWDSVNLCFGPDLVRIPLNSFVWIWFGVSSTLVRTWLGFSLRLCLDLGCIWSDFSLNSVWIWFDTLFSFDRTSIWLEFCLIWFSLSWMSLGWFDLVWSWFRFGQNLFWIWLFYIRWVRLDSIWIGDLDDMRDHCHRDTMTIGFGSDSVPILVEIWVVFCLHYAKI